MGKMITQATKVKKVLSANAEIPVNLNSLHDDVDYSSTVTRTSFEAASKDLFERVTVPIDRALEQAGMKLSDIQEVEIIGGGSRIPKVGVLRRMNPVLVYPSTRGVWSRRMRRLEDVEMSINEVTSK